MAKSLYDEFKLSNIKELNGDDIRSLTYCYMPILGLDSYALYITLTTFDERTGYNYKRILDLLSLRTLSSINNAFNKLEGIGLLKEFKKEDSLIYFLSKPLSINRFLEEESLRVLLENEIGEEEILKLMEKENKNTPVGYTNVTKKFDDVFEISVENDESIFKKIFLEKTDDITVNNIKFNYDLFEMLLENTFMKKEILEERSFKEMIKRLSFVYKLDENKMVDCVLRSFDIDQDLSYATLSKSAKQLFRENYEVKTPRLVSKEPDQFMDSAKDNDLVALSERLETLSFTDVLESLSGIKPAESEIGLFDTIYGQSNLTVGAVNCMIMMADNNKDGVLPSIQYFEKIANTWARAGVKNAYDALKFGEKEKEKRQNAKNGKRTVHIPEWYKEYKEEADKQTTDSNSKTMNQDLIDAAKKLFED